MQITIDKIAKPANSESIKIRLFFFIKNNSPNIAVSMPVYKKSWKEVLNNKGKVCKGSIKNCTDSLVIIARIITRIIRSVTEIEKNKTVGLKGSKGVLKINFLPVYNNIASAVNIKKNTTAYFKSGIPLVVLNLLRSGFILMTLFPFTTM